MRAMMPSCYSLAIMVFRPNFFNFPSKLAVDIKKKIIVLQLGNPTGLYGAERWILALSRHLDPEKVETRVAVLRDDPALNSPLYHAAVRNGFSAHMFEAYGRFNAEAVRQVRSYLREHKVDILHTHGYKTDFIGLLSVFRTGTKILSTPHGWSRRVNPKLLLYEMVDRALFPFFDAVAPLSEKLHAGLSNLPGIKPKLHLIRNGIDFTEIDSVQGAAPEIYDLKKRGFVVIGYIGQLIHRKGLDVLLQAFNRLQVPLKKLYLVGDGPQLNQLVEYTTELGLGEQVTFTGYREDRLSLLKGFDVFVLASRLEGIPRCLMEAMAARVLVVASDIPGCRDIVNGFRTGYLFKVDDPESLCQVLTRALSDRKTSASLIENARRFIESDFSAARMAHEYVRLYARLCSFNPG
jgi:glycosyltransferase involved in cell wall biosynthesis